MATIEDHKFAPFIVKGLVRTEESSTHWGIVDPSALVNVISRDIITVFTGLQEYWQDCSYKVTAGRKKYLITGVLKNVPIQLG